MTRVRKSMTMTRRAFSKHLMTEMWQSSEDEDSVTLSDLRELTFRSGKKQKKRKEMESEKMQVEEKQEKIEWRPEDCAQPVGKLVKITGKGEMKKSHYEEFKFHTHQYELEETVLLIPEEAHKRPYVAIIKDIYVQGKEGYVKLEVQWFYRREDVDEKSLAKWKRNDPRDLFYSSHRDEVFAECVKGRCVVHFVPEDKEISNRKKHPGFVVQRFYNTSKKKLEKFNANDLNEDEKHEIDILVAKTMSLVGDDLSDIKKDEKKLTSRPKRLVPRSVTPQAERVKSPESSNAAKVSSYKLILERSEMLTGDSDRDKVLEELMKAIEREFLSIKKNQAGGCDFVWPNDAVPIVRVLELVAYELFGNNKPRYTTKVVTLVNKLEESPVLGKRVLDGELKPEQVMKMTAYELTKGFTFEELAAVEKNSSSNLQKF